MKKRYVFIFLFICQIAFSQLESAHWYFGENAGIDFSSGNPVADYDGELDTLEGCASISDADGNLLFYTDGLTVYNRQHQIMQTGLYGDPSSTQSGIIVPYPGNSNLYYIFTVGADDLANPVFGTDNEGFNYYIVDMTLNGGLGGVLPFDNVTNNLMPLTSEKVTAVAHHNNQDYWVITHFEDKFYAFLVDENGINPTPVISQIGPYLDPQVYPVTSRGYLKTSPNGKFIAVAHLSKLTLDDIPQEAVDAYYPYYTNTEFTNTYNGYSAVYNFDNETGVVTNETVLSETGSPYGVEFSYLSNFLYITYDYNEAYSGDPFYIPWTHGEIIQYDMNATDISSSGVVIFDNFTTTDPFANFVSRGALQLALDKKIYYSNTSYGYGSFQSNYLSVIQSPETLGVGADFQLDYLLLNTPQNPNHYSKQGLPPFITSFFNASIEFEGDIFNNGICVGKPISLHVEANSEIISVDWDFGDGNTSNDLNPVHIYSNPGDYTISAHLITPNEDTTITRNITIHPLPEALNAELVQCDFDGDGLAIFNLSDADVLATNDAGNSVTYHSDYNDAETGDNPLPNSYTSTSNPQTIYISVKSAAGCISVSELELSTQLQTIKTAQNISKCDNLSDGTEVFDLSEIENSVSDLYNENVTILGYYTSAHDAENDIDPINPIFSNTSSPQTIYVRVGTSGCTEVVSFDLILLDLPFVDIEDAEICPEGIWEGNAENGFVTYQWNGLQAADLNQDLTQQNITITVPGTYSLTVTNENGCEYEDSFTVSVKNPPVITEILITNNELATISANGDGPFEYSLDGVLWQSSNNFINLTPGDYAVYIRDRDGCLSDKKGFGLIEIPNFISPNNDGYNDSWGIRGILNYENVHIQIFDRYGKIIVDRINNYETEIWDGKYLGRTVNTGSYWYIILLTDGRKFVGSLAVRNYDRI